MTRLFTPLLERAFRIAALHHRDQKRKASDLPYIIHPASVMLILQRAGLDDDRLLAAALLHDVVEDTACTLEELSQEFPEKVVRWVAATSEEKYDLSGVSREWLVRKRDHIAEIASADWQARAIVLADKLHNLYSMLYDIEAGEPIWDRFNAQVEHILWYNQSMLASAWNESPELDSLKQAGDEVLAQIVSLCGVSPQSPV